MNPLEEFLECQEGLTKESAKDLREKQQKELEMWRHWNANGRQPEHLQPLMHSFKPLISSKVNVYTSKIRDIPPEAIRAEFNNQFVKALETYDPNRGAGLGTHIHYNLEKAQAEAVIKALVTNGVMEPRKVGAAVFYIGTKHDQDEG